VHRTGSPVAAVNLRAGCKYESLVAAFICGLAAMSIGLVVILTTLLAEGLEVLY
jgi:uncharacterized membrane-anchored protein